MSEQQRQRRRRQRQRRRQRRRDDAPPIEGEAVEGAAEAAERPEPEAEPLRGDRAGAPAARPNTIFGMPRFVFAMTVGVAAAFLIVIVLNQFVEVGDGVEAERFPDLGRRHLAAGETFDAYSSDPPTSGPQFEAGVPSGLYGPEQPAPFDFIPAAAELLPVLEAGGLVIHYRPDLVDLDGVPGLRLFFDQIVELDFLVITANPSIDEPIVATAWGHLIRLEEVDTDALDDLARFVLDEDDRFYGVFVLERDPVIRELDAPERTTADESSE